MDWVEATHNLAYTSSYEVTWPGEPAKHRVLHFMQLGYYHWKRKKNSDPKVGRCLLSGPALNGPRGTMRALGEQLSAVIMARQITLRGVTLFLVYVPPYENVGEKCDGRIICLPGVGKGRSGGG